MQDSFTKMLFQELIPILNHLNRKSMNINQYFIHYKLKTGVKNIVIEPKLPLTLADPEGGTLGVLDK